MVENMRVRRSLTEAFSAGVCFEDCWGSDEPFWGLNLGEPALLESAAEWMEA